MSKRGVSAEEKRTRMLQLFYEKKDFFQLKELEKIAPKEKGIIAQAVKDVVQSLVDDGLIDTDKIGTSIYFWAYPSKAKKSREKMLSDLKEKLETIKCRLDQATTDLEKAKVGKEENEERDTTLRNVEELTRTKTDLLQELKKYSDSDPEVMEQMKAGIEKSKEAANRWTDNIFAIKSWCRNKFMVEETVIDKQFGIPPELDYVE